MKDSMTDRRDFLLGSSALVLSGAVASAGAEDRVRVAVVGTGGRGSDLIRALTTIDRAEIVAVCDDYPPHLENGHKYAGPAAKPYSSFSRMLRDIKPQALVIATPLHLHYEMAREGLEAECAVFCEKTMCYSLEQARKLVAAVEKKGAIFQVGLQRRANPIYRQAAAMVETGMLGRLTAIKCQWHRNNNWRRPVPVKRGDPKWKELEHRLNWRLYRDYSQGLMAELASHQMDVANWLLGAPPRRVLGSGGIDYWRDGREVYDNVFCIYEYDQKAEGTRYTVRVTYSSLQNNAYEGASELVMGTRGTLFLTQRKGLFYREAGVEDPGWSKEGRVQADASLITAGKTLKLSNDPWAHRGKPYEIDVHGDDTRDELISFLHHVQNRDAKTICDARKGLVDTATVLLANQAMREQKTVEMPADLRGEGREPKG
jgi:predicted dehydrogenase